MRRLILILVACACMAPTFGQWSDPLVKKGRDLNQRGRHLEALEHFDNALAGVEPDREAKPGLYTLLTLGRGVALSGRDQYDEALKTFLKAEKIAADLWGIYSRNYRAVSDQLLACYKALGQNDEAARLLEARLDLPADLRGTSEDFRLRDLRSLAQLHDRRMRNPKKAQEYERRALDLARSLHGEKHPDYWQSLFELGKRQLELDEQEAGIATLEQARDLAQEIFPETDDRLRVNIKALEKAYRKAGRGGQADDLRMGTAWEEQFAAPDKPASMEPYQLFIYLQKLLFADQYEEAKETLKLGIAHIEAQYSTQNPFYNLFLYDLSNIYFLEENYEEAYRTLEKANKSLDQRVRQNFGVLSEEEKGNFIRKLSTFYNNILFRAFTFGDILPGLLDLAYNNSLNLKGILLSSSRATMEMIRDKNDPELLKKYEIWHAAKKQLADAYAMPAAERDAMTTSLEKWVEQLESELIRASSDFQGDVPQPTWEDVRDALEPGEAAIEFVSMDLYDPKKHRSAYYYALLVTPGARHPVLVRLCAEPELRALLENDRLPDQSFVKSLYGSSRGLGVRVVSTEAQEEATGEELYQLIWQPLEKELEDIRKIYYSPSGLLHRIAFQALPCAEDQFLIDRYQLYRLGSTRQVAEGKKTGASAPPASVTLFGGITYDPGSDWINSEGDTGPASDGLDTTLLAEHRNLNRSGWSPLPGTREEINRLRALLAEKGASVQTYAGMAASEDQLKFDVESGAARDVLHLATHGFFFPDAEIKTEDKRISFKSSENPLIRSGLLLAGANYVWAGNPAPSGHDDGVLTAFEIANLDLRDIRLAVLSACETGLGDIQGSEGVYGLQRAFQMAGVDQLIISLWQVPDQETVELMTLFYSEWLSGKDLHDAFYYAQQEMRKKYAPYYWAAFVLIE